MIRAAVEHVGGIFSNVEMVYATVGPEEVVPLMVKVHETVVACRR